MFKKHKKISRKRLVKRACRLKVNIASILSNKSLEKIVNRHNINKKVTEIFNRPGKRTIFTNTDLDKAIELYGLSIDDLKDIAKRRLIKNYVNITKDQLYYALMRSEKSPQEDNYLKYLKNVVYDDLNEQISHIYFLLTKLDNKVSNVKRQNIKERLKKSKKKYIESTSNKIQNKIMEEIVKITNDLYDIQKQHTKLHHDQKYYGLRHLKYLFEDDTNYDAIFVRSSLKDFEEYEIPGSIKTLIFEEYLYVVYLGESTDLYLRSDTLQS